MEEQREVTKWKSCGQSVIKGLLTELRQPLMATEGAREFQERSPSVCPASLPRWPVGRAGQALGSVGPCPPEWTHRNEVC